MRKTTSNNTQLPFYFLPVILKTNSTLIPDHEIPIFFAYPIITEITNIKLRSQNLRVLEH